MTTITGLRLKAVVVSLVGEMLENGSWCGETHIQKVAYFLQSLMRVPIGYAFVLYKHGPYSFELHDDLTAMRANHFLDTKSRDPYGPSFQQGELGSLVTARFPKSIDQFKPHIDFIANQLGDKGVVELERLATAQLVTLKHATPQASVDERARKVRKLKPHIPLSTAIEAVEYVDALRKRAHEQVLQNS